ncbi:MAG: DUF805 domain-containing protein [Bacteroidota bacterium]
MHPPRKIKENKKQIMFDAFKKYAVFTGRSSRTEYWLFVVFCFLVGLAVAIITVVIGFSSGVPSYAIEDLGEALGIVTTLALIIPAFAVGCRRLHDFNASGWWVLVMLIPLLGIIAFIIIGCVEGTKGPNRFGDDPKAVPVAVSNGTASEPVQTHA